MVTKNDLKELSKALIIISKREKSYKRIIMLHKKAEKMWNNGVWTPEENDTWRAYLNGLTDSIEVINGASIKEVLKKVSY